MLMQILNDKKQILALGIVLVAVTLFVSLAITSLASPSKYRVAAVQVRDDNTGHGIAGIHCYFTFNPVNGNPVLTTTNNDSISKANSKQDDVFFYVACNTDHILSYDTVTSLTLPR